MMSSLLDGIVGRIAPPFTLAKLEGDAVFAYGASSDPMPHGAAMLDCFAECYADFRRRLRAARDIWPCWCEACARVDALDLKFILHAGAYVIHEIARRPELVGPEVVMAHRLLKTGAADVVGHSAFALVTDVAGTSFEIPTEAAVPIVETYEHYPPISAHVFALRAPSV